MPNKLLPCKKIIDSSWCVVSIHTLLVYIIICSLLSKQEIWQWITKYMNELSFLLFWGRKLFIHMILSTQFKINLQRVISCPWYGYKYEIFDALAKQVYACFMLIQRIYFIKCVNLLPYTSIFASSYSHLPLARFSQYL